MTRAQSMSRVYGKRHQKQPASGSEQPGAQSTEEGEDEPQRPARVVRMPYLAFLDPAKQKIRT